MKNLKKYRDNNLKLGYRKEFWLPKKLYNNPSAAKIVFHLHSGHLEEKALSWQMKVESIIQFLEMRTCLFHQVWKKDHQSQKVLTWTSYLNIL